MLESPPGAHCQVPPLQPDALSMGRVSSSNQSQALSLKQGASQATTVLEPQGIVINALFIWLCGSQLWYVGPSMQRLDSPSRGTHAQ